MILAYQKATNRSARIKFPPELDLTPNEPRTAPENLCRISTDNVT
jgi:hypothetical protein